MNPSIYGPVPGNVERVLMMLEKHGVGVGDDYVKLIGKPKRT
jgi:hypothetical protein